MFIVEFWCAYLTTTSKVSYLGSFRIYCFETLPYRTPLVVLPTVITLTGSRSSCRCSRSRGVRPRLLRISSTISRTSHCSSFSMNSFPRNPVPPVRNTVLPRKKFRIGEWALLAGSRTASSLVKICSSIIFFGKAIVWWARESAGHHRDTNGRNEPVALNAASSGANCVHTDVEFEINSTLIFGRIISNAKRRRAAQQTLTAAGQSKRSSFVYWE